QLDPMRAEIMAPRERHRGTRGGVAAADEISPDGSPGAQPPPPRAYGMQLDRARIDVDCHFLNAISMRIGVDPTASQTRGVELAAVHFGNRGAPVLQHRHAWILLAQSGLTAADSYP